MIKMTNASGRRLKCNKKTKIDQKESENSTYANRGTDRSKLKSLSRGSIIRSQFFNQTTRDTELLERNQITQEKWFLKRMCVLKEKKFFDNNSIYTKNF